MFQMWWQKDHIFQVLALYWVISFHWYTDARYYWMFFFVKFSVMNSLKHVRGQTTDGQTRLGEMCSNRRSHFFLQLKQFHLLLHSSSLPGQSVRRLSYSCSLLKRFNKFKCHLAVTFVRFTDILCQMGPLRNK